MTPRSALIAALAAATLTLGGCAENPGASRAGGAVAGAVAGGLLGSTIGSGSGRLIATGAGAAIGALVGSEIGRAMSEADRRQMENTTVDTLENNETGQTSRWENPDSGNEGSVTPTNTYQRDDGTYCREYQTTVTVGGEEKQAYGTACRQPDGAWKIVDSG